MRMPVIRATALLLGRALAPVTRLLLGTARTVALLQIVAMVAAALFVAGRREPADLPGTPLDLTQPIGLATHAKLVALDREPGRCRALLARAGIVYRPALSRAAPAACTIADGIVLRPAARDIAYAPASALLDCPLAAGLAMWERQVVQPAARATLGSPVVRIDHFGTYACRRIYGRAAGDWSQHAAARAIDVAGFRLADGRRITVARDWTGTGPKAAFLRQARDGACRLFSTTLSPDYNAAHRDHLHLDLAPGYGGYCR